MDVLIWCGVVPLVISNLIWYLLCRWEHRRAEQLAGRWPLAVAVEPEPSVCANCRKEGTFRRTYYAHKWTEICMSCGRIL